MDVTLWAQIQVYILLHDWISLGIWPSVFQHRRHTEKIISKPFMLFTASVMIERHIILTLPLIDLENLLRQLAIRLFTRVELIRPHERVDRLARRKRTRPQTTRIAILPEHARADSTGNIGRGRTIEIVGGVGVHIVEEPVRVKVPDGASFERGCEVADHVGCKSVPSGNEFFHKLRGT
jgi:hypothetical protein